MFDDPLFALEREDPSDELGDALTRLGRLFSTGPSVIYSLEPSPPYRPTFVSANVLALMGFEDRHFMEDPGFWVKRCHPDDLPRVSEGFEKLARTGSRTVQFRFLHRDGSFRWIEDKAQVVRDEAGKPLEIMGHMVDVTDQRREEAQTRQTHKLEAVGQLAGGMAHDLNNLLTVVLTNAELIADALPSDHPALERELQDLKEAARRGADIVRKVLAFSRREKLEKEHLDLQAWLKENRMAWQAQLPSQVDVTLLEGPAIPRTLVDPQALSQILQNLLRNAAQAMELGGSILISAQKERLFEEEWGETLRVGPGDYICLAVTDTGDGMDEETAHRVFEPFFTTRPQGQGTGLGLAMVYGLVKQHNGFIHLDTAPGEGTTFRLYFPVLEPETTVSRSARSFQGISRGRETILAVEDEPSLRRAVQKTLQKLGYTVLVAEDGLEALSVLREHGDEIDLILSDVVMPNMGGVALFETLQNRGDDYPFLFVSGYTDRDMTQGSPLDYGQPLLRKPWDVEELAERVREVLDGPR